MNGQPVISVRGEATVEVEPEIAVVGVTVQALIEAASASAQPELDLEPARQTVSAQVDARFEMTRPAAGQASS